MRQSSVDPEPWILGLAAAAILLTLLGRRINPDAQPDPAGPGGDTPPA